jgi:hypothetical protein
MASEHLATYLNDHLAGSVAMIDLLEHLGRAHAGTGPGRFATELRAEIVADQAELESLMARLRIVQSAPRKATAWIAEKATQVKLWLDDPKGGSLSVLQALEAVVVGVEGKRALWTALSASSIVAPQLQGLDYARLTERAVDQQRRIEVVRLDAARSALTAAR